MIRQRFHLATVIAFSAAALITGCSRSLDTAPASVRQTSPVMVAPRPQGAGQAGLLGGLLGGVVDTLLTQTGGVVQEIVWYPIKSLLVFRGTDATVDGGRYHLHFFKGSLPADENITIQEYDANQIDVTFGPHGTQFGTPVELSIDFSGTRFDPAVAGDRFVTPILYYWNEGKQVWEVVPGKTDWENKRHIVYLTHFSRYSLGGKAGWRGAPGRTDD